MASPRRNPGDRNRHAALGALEGSLALQVWALADAFERRLAQALGGMGLSVAGFRLIGELLAAPEGLRVGVLAKRLSVKAPSVSAMVDRFEAQGLVERITDPDDGRASRVRLAANAPLGEGLEILAAIDAELRAGLSKSAQRSLREQVMAATTRLDPQRGPR